MLTLTRQSYAIISHRDRDHLAKKKYRITPHHHHHHHQQQQQQHRHPLSPQPLSLSIYMYKLIYIYISVCVYDCSTNLTWPITLLFGVYEQLTHNKCILAMVGYDVKIDTSPTRKMKFQNVYFNSLTNKSNKKSRVYMNTRRTTKLIFTCTSTYKIMVYSMAIICCCVHIAYLILDYFAHERIYIYTIK